MITDTSSQWWILSRSFAQYLAVAERGTFVHEFLEYASHVVVADETFFGTVLLNTPYCTTWVHSNFHVVWFGPWENELAVSDRDTAKCPMKDPNHCGRSPVTLQLEDLPLLELSDNLFARKVGIVTWLELYDTGL